MNFHVANLFSYKEMALVLQNGKHVVYGQGGRAWQVTEEIADGRKWYWGTLVFETDSAVEMCAWLNMNCATLAE